MNLEAFIITNGRSTFDYVKRALEEQSMDFKITVIRDMKWVDALNKCVELCESTHYIRCDDDFILHPLAIEFMWENISQKPMSAFCVAKLWEDWTRKPVGGIKIYNRDIVADLGGFKASHLGKVDKIFKKRLDRSKYSTSGCGKSIVGLHACGEWKEQLRYEALWSSLAKSPYKKTTHDVMSKYTKSVRQQFKMRKKFIENKNRSKKTDFYRFIKNRSS